MRNYKTNKTTIECNEAFDGEPLSWKINRAMTTGEPLDMCVSSIFTKRSDGVQPQYDIRTDRFEIAREAMRLTNRAEVAKRMEIGIKQETKISDKTESTDATTSNSSE